MFEDYSRKPFDVKAVQVSLENSEEVAKWCGGRVELIDYKLMGVKTKLPCVKLPVQGPRKIQEPEALLGHWVVQMKGIFRVYRPTSFADTFEKKMRVVDEGVRMHSVGPVDRMLRGPGFMNGTLFEENEPNYAHSNSGPFHPIPTPAGMPLHHTVVEALQVAAKKVEENFGSSDLPKDAWVRVTNEGSDHFGQTGWVLEFQGEGLYRVRMEKNSREFSFMRHELEKFELTDV